MNRKTAIKFSVSHLCVFVFALFLKESLALRSENKNDDQFTANQQKTSLLARDSKNTSLNRSRTRENKIASLQKTLTSLAAENQKYTDAASLIFAPFDGTGRLTDAYILMFDLEESQIEKIETLLASVQHEFYQEMMHDFSSDFTMQDYGAMKASVDDISSIQRNIMEHFQNELSNTVSEEQARSIINAYKITSPNLFNDYGGKVEFHIAKKSNGHYLIDINQVGDLFDFGNTLVFSDVSELPPYIAPLVEPIDLGRLENTVDYGNNIEFSETP